MNISKNLSVFFLILGIIPTIGVHGQPASSKQHGEGTNDAAWPSSAGKRRTSTWLSKGSPQKSSASGQPSLQASLQRTPCAACNASEACTLPSFLESPTFPNPLSLTSLWTSEHSASPTRHHYFHSNQRSSTLASQAQWCVSCLELTPVAA